MKILVQLPAPLPPYVAFTSATAPCPQASAHVSFPALRCSEQSPEEGTQNPMLNGLNMSQQEIAMYNMVVCNNSVLQHPSFPSVPQQGELIADSADLLLIEGLIASLWPISW